jgi:hypothetical protein
MASRKQRKRRQKELRHEYEYVYVDEEGREVEVDEPPAAKPDRRGERNGAGTKTRGAADRRGRAKATRPGREARPPSWQRSWRRSLLFFPLFFLVFSLISKKTAVETRILMSLFYSLLFIPMTYLMDRAAYRAHVRRTGGETAAKRR